MCSLERITVPIDSYTYVLIDEAREGDGFGMLQAHQTAFAAGYVREDGAYGATKEALQGFVSDKDPDGFATRNGLQWENAARHRTLGTRVARLCRYDDPGGFTDTVIGIGTTTGTAVPGELYVGGMYLNPDFHRRGIGKALLRASLLDFKTATIANLDVVRWADAAGFYAHLGFEVQPDITVDAPSYPKKFGIKLLQQRMTLCLGPDAPDWL